jgi:transmembrane sensor
MTEPGAQQARARDEAASWFARLSRVSVSTATLHEFRAWRARPENAEAYEKLEATWRAAGELAGDPDLSAAAAKAQRDVGPALRARRRAMVAMGALSALGAAAAVWLLVAAPESYETAIGEQRLVVLDDGSRVRLNTDSHLKVRYNGAMRRLTLARGQAFFEVAKDPSRPFVVKADEVTVTALGTRFDVRRSGKAVQVTLVEGQVAVDLTAQAQTARLRPNQQLIAGPDGLSQPRPADPEEATGWTTGRLTFRNVPLREAVAEVNRYAQKKLVLDAPAEIADAPVSGVFDVGDRDAFATAVTALFPLAARSEVDGRLRLAPRPPDDQVF